MGVYLYAIRKSGGLKVRHGDEVMYIHRMQYMGKPFSSYWNTSMAKVRLSRIEQAWDSEMPEYFTILDGEEKPDGKVLAVYRSTGVLKWYDCDALPGERVGWLVVNGRKKTFVSEEAAVETLRLVSGYKTMTEFVNMANVQLVGSEDNADVLFMKRLHKSAAFTSRVEIVNPNAAVI